MRPRTAANLSSNPYTPIYHAQAGAGTTKKPGEINQPRDSALTLMVMRYMVAQAAA